MENEIPCNDCITFMICKICVMKGGTFYSSFPNMTLLTKKCSLLNTFLNKCKGNEKIINYMNTYILFNKGNKNG